LCVFSFFLYDGNDNCTTSSTYSLAPLVSLSSSLSQFGVSPKTIFPESDFYLFSAPHPGDSLIVDNIPWSPENQLPKKRLAVL